MKQTVIYCSPQVRRLWPSPLAAQWASLYPHLFDCDDVRITQLQPKNHFSEWFAAIHLFHRDGVLSLVEKYVYSTHPRKKAIVSSRDYARSARRQKRLARICEVARELLSECQE